MADPPAVPRYYAINRPSRLPLGGAARVSARRYRPIAKTATAPATIASLYNGMVLLAGNRQKFRERTPTGPSRSGLLLHTRDDRHVRIQ